MIDTKQFEKDVAELEYLQARLLDIHKQWIDKINLLRDKGYTTETNEKVLKYIFPVSKVTLSESISKKICENST